MKNTLPGYFFIRFKWQKQFKNKSVKNKPIYIFLNQPIILEGGLLC